MRRVPNRNSSLAKGEHDRNDQRVVRTVTSVRAQKLLDFKREYGRTLYIPFSIILIDILSSAIMVVGRKKWKNE